MQQSLFLLLTFSLTSSLLVFGGLTAEANDLDKILRDENAKLGVTEKPMPVAEDLAFLRRASVDLISRIPTIKEIDQYMKWPQKERRGKLIEKLMTDSRFTDRWTVFFSDMLRLRSNSPGGSALIAYVHNAIQTGMPYDELSRRLIATNGKANSTPEVGFILGDDADPFAMASVTSQVFMGVRMGCAQCHDHPFDVWTQKDFYSMAAFFGKTRRVETRFTRVIYTTEANQSSVLWPPEEMASSSSEKRKPIVPRFPVKFEKGKSVPDFVARFEKLRKAIADREAAELAKKAGSKSIDDLVDSVANKANKAVRGELPNGTIDEAKDDIRKIDIKASLYRKSELREKLAEFVTNPQNRFFSQALVNRVWKELVGRGFVEPIDDFRKDNPPVHPELLNHLSQEFVANGFDFRWLVREIVSSDIYARAHAPDDAEHVVREKLESNFLATPMRRMIGEALFDSVVTAGHLSEFKHLKGQNLKVAYQTIRVPKESKPDDGKKDDGKTEKVDTSKLAKGNSQNPAMMKEQAQPISGGYALEDAIELDFNALLSQKDKDEVALDKMNVMSKEELEAQRMMETKKKTKGVEYITKRVKREYDDNPKFNSSLRIASPAPLGHFLRVFGQPGREQLGDLRQDNASMRQALLMLNGRLSHEASRVGQLEPIYKLLVGKNADLDKAVKFAYRELLTRDPSATEVAEAKEIIGDKPLKGMADLRWVLLNCNEFRFLP